MGAQPSRETVMLAGKPVELTLANLDRIVEVRMAERRSAELRAQRACMRGEREQREMAAAHASIDARRVSVAALAAALATNPLKDLRNVAFLHREDFAEDTAEDIAFRISMLQSLEKNGQSVADLE